MKTYNIPIKDPLIVMGNGPSLKTIDLELLRNKDTFGVKDAYRLYPKLNWYPKFWGAFDLEWFFYNNNLMLVKEFIETKKSICFLQSRDIFKMEFDNVIYMPFTSNLFNIVNDIPNYPLVMHDGGSSVYNACKIGINLGYKKIILVGTDCTYNVNTLAPYFNENIPAIPYNVNNVNKQCKTREELWNYINKTQNDTLLSLSQEYYKVDFVNCGGPLSELDGFRRGKIENEL